MSDVARALLRPVSPKARDALVKLLRRADAAANGAEDEPAITPGL